MSHIAEVDHSESQRELLKAVVEKFRRGHRAVTASEIAERTDADDVTARIKSLQALHLVETEHGAGDSEDRYEPTPNAYDSLGIEMDGDERAAVPILRNSEIVSGVNVAEIDLTDVQNSNDCTAEIHVRGTVSEFSVGDSVEVGPTPVSKLIIHGDVTETVSPRHIIRCHITRMTLDD